MLGRYGTGHFPTYLRAAYLTPIDTSRLVRRRRRFARVKGRPRLHIASRSMLHTHSLHYMCMCTCMHVHVHVHA